MKKALCVIVLLMALFAHGQENSNPWRVGGNFGANFGSDDYIGVSVSPFLGYEITPKLLAGLSVGYRYSQWKDVQHNLFSGGPFLNYYPIAGLFARVHYEYYTGTSKDKITDTSFNYDESALWLGGGYHSQGRVRFHAGLMYNVLFDEEKSIFSSGLRPFVGVSIGL